MPETLAGISRSITVDGLGGVSRELWDSIVAPGQGPLRHAFVAAWSRADLAGLELRPLVVRAPATGEMLAAAPGYFYDFDMARVQSPPVAASVRAARLVRPRLLVSRVFEMGSSAPLVTPFLRTASAEGASALGALVDEGLAEARRGDASMVIVQSFETAEGPAAAELRARGFSPVPIPQTVVVHLPYTSFDEYLAAMRSQYRRRVKLVFSRSSALEAVHARDFAHLAPELARLYRLVWDRSEDVKREVLTEPFFRAASALDELSVLLLRRPDGSIASFALLLDDQPWLHFLCVGFEEGAGREEGAYFRLLYEIVRHGIEGGFPSVNLGMTTLEPKLDTGGVPVPLYAWIRHRNRALQRVYVQLAGRVFAPAPVAARKVFKG